MAFEDGHPNVPLADWQNFLDWHESSKMFPSHPFEQVVDRSQLSLRDNLFPLARGGAIASRSLLRKAGYRSGAQHRRNAGFIRGAAVGSPYLYTSSILGQLL